MRHASRSLPTREELANIAQMLGTPIDFDALIEAGILRRRTKYTYELLDKSRLPKYVSHQAKALSVSPQGSPVVLTFGATSKSAQKSYEKLTGKTFTPVEESHQIPRSSRGD